MNFISSPNTTTEFLGDAHRHLSAQQSSHPHHPIENEPVIICSTDPSEWPKVKELSSPFSIPAFGIHPWKISPENFSTLKKSISSLSAYWASNGQQNLPCILGEIGLDNSPRHQATINLQQNILQALLDFPFPTWRILNLHVVHAWNLLLASPLREKIFELPHQKVILHSFNGSAEIIRQLQKYPQVYFSFAKAHLNPKTAGLISQLNPARILLESDRDQPANSEDILLMLRQTKKHIAQLGHYNEQEFDQHLKHNWHNLMQKI